MRRGVAVLLVALGCVIALSGSAALAADQVFIVTSQADNDDGACNAHCTFREAILAANAAAGHDTILFNISGDGVHTILASGSPPIITSPVSIDATFESDYAGIPRVELDGVSTGGANGLFFSVNSGASLVRGLGINRWGPGITTQAGVSLTVHDNYIGVSAGDGVTPRPNQSGIVFLGGSSHIVVGNLISGNSQAGLRAIGSGRTPPGRRRSPTG
jgi:CSLREA domain-containing protein